MLWNGKTAPEAVLTVICLLRLRRHLPVLWAAARVAGNHVSVFIGQPRSLFVNITCPRCGFSRELPADRAPSKAVIATCPNCACRFRFVPGTGVTDVISEPQEPTDHSEQQGGQPQSADSDYSSPASTADQQQPPQGGWHSGGDDPLPPGAIVPGSSSPRSGAGSGAGSAADAGADTKPAGEPRYTAGAGDRKQGVGKNAPNDGDAKNLGNLWGLLGGKNIFGQWGGKQGDDDSDKRTGDRPRDRNDDHDNRRPPNGKSQRSVFGADDDRADDNRTASEAYAREAARFENQDEDSRHLSGNPWDIAPEPDGWIPAFYHTCMRVMFGAHNFYENVRADASQVRPLIFYLIISVIQVIIERVWSGIFLSLMSPSAASDPELERMLILLSPQLSLPMTILLKTGVSVVQLYVLTALMHFTYGFITGKRPEFSLVFQVAAYAAAPSLLCVVPLLGSIVGFIWMVACVLVGCRTVLNLTWPQAFMGFAPVVLLLAPLLLQVMKAAQF